MDSAAKEAPTALRTGVARVIVVGFHHTEGNRVEWAVPAIGGPSDIINSYDLETLPFFALPDGAHMSDEDFTFFTLPPKRSEVVAASDNRAQIPAGSTLEASQGRRTPPSVGGASEPGVGAQGLQPLYGVTCFMQVASKDLLVVSADVSRSTVQKAVCVLSWEPNFAWLLSRVQPITRQYFSQKNFEDRGVLNELYQSIVHSSSGVNKDGLYDEGSVCPSRSLVSLTKALGRDLLTVLKLVLLEKRIIFVSYKGTVHRASASVVSLLSLLPGLIVPPRESSSDPVTGRRARWQAFGFPLQVCTRGSTVYPYFCLQQMQGLDASRAYLIGVSNVLFLRNSPIPADAVVDLVTGEVRIVSEELKPITALSASDRRFMDTLVAICEADDEQSVNDYDECVRGEFQRYMEHLLCSTADCHSLTRPEGSIYAMLRSEPVLSPALESFNPLFIRAWSETQNFAMWRSLLFSSRLTLSTLSAPMHPADTTPTVLQNIATTMEPITSKVSDVVRSAGNKLAPAVDVALDAREKAGELASRAGSWLAGAAKAAPGTGRAIVGNIAGLFSGEAKK